jgi:hypothetical protein
MLYQLDIYFESAEDGLDDFYIERTWNAIPDVGDAIVYEHREEGEPASIWQGSVTNRLFVTDNEGNLRIQLHCSALVLTDVKTSDVNGPAAESPAAEDAVDTL